MGGFVESLQHSLITHSLLESVASFAPPTPSPPPLASFSEILAVPNVLQDVKPADDSSRYRNDPGAAQLVKVQKKENIIERSLDKLKETSTHYPCYDSPELRKKLILTMTVRRNKRSLIGRSSNGLPFSSRALFAAFAVANSTNAQPKNFPNAEMHLRR